ncbi:unnamed protein product [Ophioblennius macclurei]
MELLLSALSFLLLWTSTTTTTTFDLDPNGRNVCPDAREPSSLACCAGWRREGKECTIPVCEGALACLKDEVCVSPGVCRCPPGYFGAQCKTRCPPEFWAPDCRQVCPCYPHGRCHPATGECTCYPNRWGALCQNTCKCSRNGRCHPAHGNCTCEEGWWTATCTKPCQCSGAGRSSGAACDQLTGRCKCLPGHWGQRCGSACVCNQSPCDQRNGLCVCTAGRWGFNCEKTCTCDLAHGSCDPASGRCLCHPGYHGDQCSDPCEAGYYGSGCKKSCGYCEDDGPCSPTDGACRSCQPGWNGTRCDRTCLPGYYGDGCKEACPHCRNEQPCDHKTGKCWSCDPGWSGPRCEEACHDGTFGDACHFLCGPCFHGNCHHVTGRCVCQPGFQGDSCNSSCPALTFGLNCSSVCSCGGGVSCHPVTGSCPNSNGGAVLLGVLVPLLLLLLAVLCCCLCCGGRVADGKDRETVADGGVSARMKYHVYSVLANIGAALPCISDWSSGLPRVTVSHHDPELTFNHSFIEPPSSGWVTEGSSFDSDEEEAEALYCVPPREDVPAAAAGGEFQEMSSKCNMFLDPAGFSSEDVTAPFSIPRTSSIAKAKRPSVSFAEGTRFSPKERRGSAQDPAPLLRGKAKSPWGVLMLSALQGQGVIARTGEEVEGEEREDAVDAPAEPEDQDRTTSQVSGLSGRKRTTSNAAAHKATQPSGADAPDKVTTVYVTVGKAGRPVTKAEPSGEGPVQAMLRRLGSLQRQREAEPGRSRAKGGGAEGIVKPPRRKLGARASLWEQGAPPAGEASGCKPVDTAATAPNEAPPPENATPKRPLSSILKSVPELTSGDPGSGDQRQGGAETESNYLTVGPAGGAAGLTEVIANEGAVVDVTDEPCYENVLVKHS